MFDPKSETKPYHHDAITILAEVSDALKTTWKDPAKAKAAYESQATFTEAAIAGAIIAVMTMGERYPEQRENATGIGKCLFTILSAIPFWIELRQKDNIQDRLDSIVSLFHDLQENPERYKE